MRKMLTYAAVTVLGFLFIIDPAFSQEYKMKQVNKMMGMNNESTIYVKKSRKRTEAAGMMGMGAKTVTIEQCDLQRTVKLNDNKKLYFIIPFAKDEEEIIDEDKPAPKNKPTTPAPVVNKNAPKKGGIIYNWYYIYDTLVRENMFGFPARHIYTWRKMKPSADACYMKDSMEIRTDGWYIDLPEFICPIVSKPQPPSKPGEVVKPDCMDKYVSYRRGKGKLGFPLKETTTMIMGGQTSSFETGIEVVEFSKMKLDSMLFEIPPGYTQAAKEEDLNEAFSMADMIKNANANNANNNANNNNAGNIIDMIKNQAGNQAKKTGMVRIGVYQPKGEGGYDASSVQNSMTITLTTGNIEAIAVVDETEARAKNCDYSLASEFAKFKSGSKVGGLLKAIKNADPNAASSFNIEANLTLTKLLDGSVKTNPKVEGKYEGKPDVAATNAMNEGCNKVLKAFE